MFPPSPIPHPLFLFPECPGWILELFEFVVGAEWPEGNEKLTWDLADAWYAVAADLDAPTEDVLSAGPALVAAFGGVGNETGFAVDALWRYLAEDPQSGMRYLQVAFTEIAIVVDATACDIEAAKIEMWIEVGFMVGELLLLAVAIALTMGAATPGVGLVAATTRFFIGQIFRRLMQRIASRVLRSAAHKAFDSAVSRIGRNAAGRFGLRAVNHGLREGIEEGGTELAIQTSQMQRGHRDAGLDVASLGLSTLGGFAGGATAGIAGLGPHASSKLGGWLESAGRGAAAEAIAETGASIATGGGIPTLDELARSATSGLRSDLTLHATDQLHHRADELLDTRTPAPRFDPPPTGTTDPTPAGTDPPPTTDSRPSHTSEHRGIAASGAPASPSTMVGQGPAYVGGDVYSGSPGSTTTPAPSLTSVAHTGPMVSDLTTTSAPTGTGTPSTVHSGPETAGPATVPGGPPPPPSAEIHSGQAVTAPSPAASLPVAPQTPPTPATPTAPVAELAGLATTTAPPPSAVAAPLAPPAPLPPSGAGTEPRIVLPLGPATPTPQAGPGPPSAVRPSPPPSTPSTAPPRPPDLLDVHRPPETVGTLGDADAARERMTELWRTYERFRRHRSARTLQVVIDHLGQAGAALSLLTDDRIRAGDQYGAERLRDRQTRIYAALRMTTDHRDRVLLAPDAEVIVERAIHIALNLDFGETVPGGVAADDVSALTGSGLPPPAEASRRYLDRGGHRPPLRFDQETVERLVPRDAGGRWVRFADVRGAWLTRVNDSGPGLDPTRGINCVDCVAAFLDTWFHGRPRVSAARTFDSYLDGRAELPLHGERDGMGRLRGIVGAEFVSYAIERPGYDAAATYHTRLGWTEDDLRRAGPGSVAIIAHQQRDGASHVWLAVNQDGEILYVDPQHGRVSDRPLYRDVHGPTGIVELQLAAIDARGRPLHPGTTPAPWLADDPTGTHRSRSGDPADYLPFDRTDLDPNLRPGETSDAAAARVALAELARIYNDLGAVAPHLDLAQHEAAYAEAHTIEHHGPTVRLHRDPTGVERTIEGRIYGDHPWPRPENFSYRWRDRATMTLTINRYLVEHWWRIRSDLAADREHHAVVTIPGEPIGEGFFNPGQHGTGSRSARPHWTNLMQIRITVGQGDPAPLIVVTAFPAGRG